MDYTRTVSITNEDIDSMKFYESGVCDHLCDKEWVSCAGNVVRSWRSDGMPAVVAYIARRGQQYMYSFQVRLSPDAEWTYGKMYDSFDTAILACKENIKYVFEHLIEKGE